jgi:flagellar biosynthesis/type III secretory pathway chaperone
VAATATASPEVAPLVSILTKEQAIYQKLLEVAAEEREAIVAGHLPGLKAALQRKQDILVRLSELEDRRVLWVGRYARKHDIALETLSLADIIASSSGRDRGILTRLHAGLRRRIDQLVKMDAITKALLDRILSSIDTSLKFLLADDGASQIYGARGRLQAAPAASRQLLETQA